eukprot:m.97058 g.97058  ORF g.97058 m.97058 type:complete len:207 (-) comp26945_c0_seq2:357-977(-)
MGCGGSKSTGGLSQHTSTTNAKQDSNDLVTSQLLAEDFNHTLPDEPLSPAPPTKKISLNAANADETPPNSKSKIGKRLSVDPQHEQRMLLENWQKPTDHKAHKKIMGKVGTSPATSPPQQQQQQHQHQHGDVIAAASRGKRRVSDGAANDVNMDELEEASDSEDEKEVIYDDNKNRVDDLPPGAVPEGKSILTLFRPKTPLILDLD